MRTAESSIMAYIYMQVTCKHTESQIYAEFCNQ